MTELEAERRRLAQRLESDIISALTLLNDQTQAYAAALRGDPQASMALTVLSSLVSQTLQKARHLQTNLHPTILETLGLEPALEAYAADEQRIRGLTIALSLQRFRERLPASDEVLLFRAVQSLVDQGVEHAFVTRIELTLSQHGQQTKLIYADNGQWHKPALRTVQALYQQMRKAGAAVTGDIHDGTLRVTIHIEREAQITLTPREREIIGFVAEGLTNQEIAAHLHLSARTINFHLDNVYSKLNVNSRTEAAMIAVQHGWIDLPPT